MGEGKGKGLRAQLIALKMGPTFSACVLKRKQHSVQTELMTHDIKVSPLKLLATAAFSFLASLEHVKKSLDNIFERTTSWTFESS